MVNVSYMNCTITKCKQTFFPVLREHECCICERLVRFEHMWYGKLSAYAGVIMCGGHEIGKENFYACKDHFLLEEDWHYKLEEYLVEFKKQFRRPDLPPAPPNINRIR